MSAARPTECLIEFIIIIIIIIARNSSYVLRMDPWIQGYSMDKYVIFVKACNPSYHEKIVEW